MEFRLTSTDSSTALLKSKGIDSWLELLTYIQELPYGRNTNRSDLGLVLVERKGTCSSKHAFLKMIAERNSIPNVRLILGLYRMNAENTPGLGNTLDEYGLDFIPEAHCYLKIADSRMDLTTSRSEISRIEIDILEEQEIDYEQVVDFKTAYHKEYLRKWLFETGSDIRFEQLWRIREQCIQNLRDK